MRPAAGHHLVRGARRTERQDAADGYRQLPVLEHCRDLRQARTLDVNDQIIRANAVWAGELIIRVNYRRNNGAAGPYEREQLIPPLAANGIDHRIRL
jgi:hypothetical protein